MHDNTEGLELIYKEIVSILSSELQWIIKDSGYSTTVIDWYKLKSNNNIKLIVSKDSGIYDALNTAIKYVNSNYYLVLGSDDLIISNGIKDLLFNLKLNKYKNYDFISFPVLKKNQVYDRRNYIPVSWSVSSIVVSHSCGLVINKSVHSMIGLYSTKYKILSDSLLILKAYKLKCNFYHENFVIGSFCTEGISSNLTVLRSIEAFKIQIESGSLPLLQIIFIIIRIFCLNLKKLQFLIRNIL